MELKELFEAERIKILFEGKAKDSHMSVLVPWIQADKKNLNDRIYPMALLQRETARVQKAVESGAFIGTGDHPAGGMTDIATASHIVRKIWLDEDGKGQAEIRILPTARGKNIMALIKGGARLGISSRGFGNVDEKTRRVKDDYKLQGIDIVTNPSFVDATFDKSNVFESVDFEPKKAEKTKKGFSLERLEEIMLDFFQRDNDFRGSFSQWKEKFALPIYAKNMVEQGICSSVEEGLKMLNAGVEKKEPRSKVLPKDVLIEAQIAGTSAIALAKRINAGIDREIEEAKNNLTVKQRVKILSEAQNAGIDIHNSEERAKVLESARKQKGKIVIEKVKPITEAKKKELLMREKTTAGYRNSLFEPKKK